MAKKDEIFSRLWESFKLDSISGQWDYVEPALFGYAAGKLIESFTKFNLNARLKVIAQFHEWMCGGGLLYLNDNFPQVATVFTTHATVIGRSIAGNNLPLYGRLKEYDGDDKSNDFNVTSKQSLEKLAAQHADAFTTVSRLTSGECLQFLKKEVDVVTPNGFEDSFVPQGDDFTVKRKEARELLLKIARKLTGEDIGEDAWLLATSGRYEYRNKGLDVFTDALGKINKSGKLKRNIIAFYLIPAHHYGPRKDLLVSLQKDSRLDDPANCCLTHYLHSPENDPVLKKIRENDLANKQGNQVRIVFVPSYLQGNDGIFQIDLASDYCLFLGTESDEKHRSFQFDLNKCSRKHHHNRHCGSIIIGSRKIHRISHVAKVIVMRTKYDKCINLSLDIADEVLGFVVLVELIFELKRDVFCISRELFQNIKDPLEPTIFVRAKTLMDCNSCIEIG